MRDVAVVAFAQSHHLTQPSGRSEVELLAPVLTRVIESAGVDRHGIGFTCSGSNDYLTGSPFAFVSALDAVGAWPPIAESHVEADGAWALYEAWTRLQHGDLDTALVYGFGQATQPVDVRRTMGLQYDPYYLAPLGLDQTALAGLSARAYLERSGTSEDDLAAVVAAARERGAANPQVDVPEAAGEEYVAAPLRRRDIAPGADGAAAVILAAGDRARELCERPAWIRGIAHCVDAHLPGVRDLSRVPSASDAARAAGLGKAPVDVAELHAVYAHEVPMLREALGLGDDVDVNPSGGALLADPIMATGLVRIGEAASRVQAGSAGRAVGHAASGPCLQQNLVCVLEGD